MAATFSTDLVEKIAGLANIPITAEEETKLATAFVETIDVIANLQELDTTAVEPTGHTTGSENVLRDDVVQEETMFSQEQALQNATRTHDGFFVVPRIINNE